MLEVSLPKIDGTSDQPAVEMNSVFYELQNTIQDAGITLSGSDLEQIGKTIAIYAGSGDFYADTGSANTYVLSPIGSKKSPPTYTDGMRVRFNAANANTGASTINVGGVGAVGFVQPDNTALTADQITTDEYVQGIYHSSISKFVIESVISKKVATVAEIALDSLQNLPNGVPTVLDFVAVDIDTFKIFSVPDGVIKPVNAGLYEVKVRIAATFTGSGALGNDEEVTISLSQNGAPLIVVGMLNEALTAAAITEYAIPCVSVLVIFNGTTDYLQIVATYTEVASSLTITTAATLGGLPYSIVEVNYIGALS